MAGQEGRLRRIVQRELVPLVDDLRLDALGNVVAREGATRFACDTWAVATVLELARQRQIPHQTGILRRGGTDSGAMQHICSALSVVTLSVPCRNVHTCVERADLRDVAPAAEPLAAYLEEGGTEGARRA